MPKFHLPCWLRLAKTVSVQESVPKPNKLFSETMRKRLSLQRAPPLEIRLHEQKIM